ncbi:MAG: metallophosphoesterase family protein [Clostridia bacterium]|nr:metallophosphoesterase family protein [Clostridia bacterium]
MKFLASADLHIRKKEDCALLARLLQAAKDAGCGAVLIGGDLLDTPFIEEETENAVRALLGAAPCPVFLVAGNHDPLAITALYRDLPAHVQVFPAEMTAYTLADGVRLYGYSALREQVDTRFLAGFSAPEGGINILLAHGQMDGSHGDFQPISAEELAGSNLQLVILGHIHKGEQRRVGGCRLLVPGIPEGRGWDETGDKYLYIIDTEQLSAEPLSVASRRFMEYEVDLTDCRDTGEMLAKMESLEIPANVEYRLILVGTACESPAPAVQAFIEKTGREVKDLTDTFSSLKELRGQNTLQGAFVRRAMAEIEAASPEERPRLERALRLGLQALKEARL